jgi:hypothetical protein
MSITLFKKNLADSMFGAPVELRTDAGWVQWRAADSADAWSNLFPVPADGADGSDGLQGLPGAPGASVELREYFDTLQWRQVGTEVWNHLINLSEITGADGREIELYVLDEVLHWRYVGETEGTPFLELADLKGAPGECECEDDIPAPTNSAQSRCGVSVRVTEAVKAAYTRAKLDPDAWDELQTLANQAQAGGAAAVVASQALAIVLGAGLVTSGVGLFGSLILGAGTFFGGILGLTNDNTDQFTPGRQDALQQGLYCVLTRQETADISADVLREWVSYIADAGFPTADRDIILAILAWTPISYWRNEAAVASPEINPCSGLSCVAPDDPFAYEFIGQATPGYMRFIDPLAAALMTVVVGTRGDDGIIATPTLLNTMRFNVRVNFGRIIPLSQIEMEVAYNQTRNAVSNITIAGEGFSQTTTLNGISNGFKRLYALSPGSVSEFSISGEVATTGEFDADAYLDLFQLKICGEGFPPWGVMAINADACTPPLCAELDSLGYTKMIDFCFRESDYGMIPQTMNQQTPQWVAGEGWKSGWRTASNVGYRQMVITWPRAWANQTMSNMLIRVEYSLALGTSFGGTGQYLWLTGASGVVNHINLDRTNANAQQPVYFTVPANRNFGPGNVRLQITSGQRFNADPGGQATIHRITFYHNEATDPYTILPGDL